MGMCLQRNRADRNHRTDICSIFLNRIINFIGVGFSLYALAATYQHFSRDPIIKHMIKCKYCRKRISEKVGLCGPCPVSLSCVLLPLGSHLTCQSLRCVNCTSWLDGREERHAGL